MEAFSAPFGIFPGKSWAICQQAVEAGESPARGPDFVLKK